MYCDLGDDMNFSVKKSLPNSLYASKQILLMPNLKKRDCLFAIPEISLFPSPWQKDPGGQSKQCDIFLAPSEGRYVPGGHLFGSDVPMLQ